MSSTKMNKNVQITDEQKHLMVQFIEGHDEMIKPKYDNKNSRAKMESLWKDLATLLNGCSGPKKSEHQWKRSWSDLRRTSKLKAVAVKTSLKKSGGAPLDESEQMTPLHERIVSIIGDSLINGDPYEDKETEYPIADDGEPNPLIPVMISMEYEEPQGERTMDEAIDSSVETPLPHRTPVRDDNVRSQPSEHVQGKRSSSLKKTVRSVNTFAENQRKSLEVQERLAATAEATLQELRKQTRAMEAFVAAYKSVHNL